MSLYEELCQKFMADLQSGLKFRRKTDEGKWVEEIIPYEILLKNHCQNVITRKVFLSMYKKLPQIETFPPEEKTEWKKYVNEIFPGTPPQFRLDAVKIIYTIGTLT